MREFNRIEGLTFGTTHIKMWQSFVPHLQKGIVNDGDDAKNSSWNVARSQDLIKLPVSIFALAKNE